MKIRVRHMEVELELVKPYDLRYDIIVKFSPEELQSMHWARGQQLEEVIDAIGEGVKSELRRIEQRNKKK